MSKIKRIVKMELKEESVAEFLAFFDEVKHHINNFEGCHGMQLLQDVTAPNILFTYSWWDSEEALNAYRYSELFAKVWPATKKHFKNPAQAWSTNAYFDGFSEKK